MPGQVFELAILLSLKDAASGKLDHVRSQLRATGKEGQDTLQSFEQLRKGLSRDLAIGGVGVAGLALFNRGVKASGDYQASITDLRVSITELNRDGSVNLNQLGDQMNRFDRLGMKLGNSLPGSTQDFVEMFAVLKQKGLETEAILNGAGEAVGNLAVVSKERPKELAIPFAEFGQQFQLKGQDFPKLADLFARARSATGSTPGELVEASKYFQLRAGTGLGLTGFEGAEMTTRLLALLGRKGLKGSEAGTGLSALFSRLTATTPEQKDVLKDLKKKGIDLQFFDKKGKFQGIENAVAQLEKLRVLDQQTRGIAVKKLFEQEGAAAANILIDEGAEGLKRSNEELQRRLSLQQQVTEQTKGYNAKMEALSGTLENLKATAFGPMLGPMTAVADKANLLVGSLQEFAAAHPTLAATTTGIFGIGSAALVAYSGVRILTTGWRLWKIVSAVGSGEEGLLRFLRGAGTEAAGSATKVNGLGGSLKALPKTVQVTLLLASIGYTLHEAMELLDAVDKYNKSQPGWQRAGKDNLQSLNRLEQTSQQAGVKVDPNFYKADASNALRSLNIEGNAFSDWLKEYGLQGSNRAMFTEQAKGEGPTQLLNTLTKGVNIWVNGMNVPAFFSEKYRMPFLPNFFPAMTSDPAQRAQFMQRRAPQLENPNVMSAFRQQLEEMKLGPSVTQTVNQWLAQAFPDSFAKSTQMLTGNFQELSKPTIDLTKGFSDLRAPVLKLPPELGNAGDAAQAFADRVNSLTITAPAVAGSPAAGGTGGAPTGRPSILNMLQPSSIYSPPAKSPVQRAHAVLREPSATAPPVQRNQVERVSLDDSTALLRLQPQVFPVVIEPPTRRSEPTPNASPAPLREPPVTTHTVSRISDLHTIERNNVSELRTIERNNDREVVHPFTAPPAQINQYEPVALDSLASLLKPQQQAATIPRLNTPSTPNASLREPLTLRRTSERVVINPDVARRRVDSVAEDNVRASRSRADVKGGDTHINRRNYFYINGRTDAKVTAREVMREMERREARA